MVMYENLSAKVSFSLLYLRKLITSKSGPEA